jgi:hypothetical protein
MTPLRSLERTIIAVGLALTLASLAWRSAALTAGVAIGAAAMWLNFRWLARIVRGALDLAERAGDDGPGGGLAAARLAIEFVVKFAALIALVYLLISRTGVDVLGLLVGLSTVVVAGLVETVRGGSRRARLTDRPGER